MDQTGDAFGACQALFDKYPDAARHLDDTDLLMPVATGSGPHDLVRHVFGSTRRVFFRMYPAGESQGIQIDPGSDLPEVALMLAGAVPVS